MAKKNDKPKPKMHPAMVMLTADSYPFADRKGLLQRLVMTGGQEGDEVIENLLEAAKGQTAESALATEYERMLAELRRSPLRMATFITMRDTVGSVSLAEVCLENGDSAYLLVPDAEVAKTLQCGDTVAVSAGPAMAVMRRIDDGPSIGEEAVLERRIDSRVEVRLRGDERCVFFASHRLLQKLEAGEVEIGQVVLVNARQRLAFDALPTADGLAYYRFLSREPVPRIDIAREIAAPPAFIEELADIVQAELTAPQVRRELKLPRIVTKLLEGVSGSGKSLSITATIRRVYEVVSESTGVPVEQLPHRIFRLRADLILDPYLGVSDRNLGRFIDEVEKLADEEFAAPDGRRWRLPVIVVMEECEGLGRRRGEIDSSVFDRILTNLLQRFDPGRYDLREKLILFLATSNEASLIDRALLRRISGTVETFGRLGRRSFAAVLGKHLNGLPLDAIHDQMVAAITAWMFARNGDNPPVVELVYAGSTTVEQRHRRDFLTGALVQRAVQQASEVAFFQSRASRQPARISQAMLQTAFAQQIQATVNQLTEHNAGHHLDLPAGARVASVRKIAPPAMEPVEFQTGS